MDSDDDHSASSQPVSPRNQNHNQGVPNNLISVIPTPINGSRDTLADSLRVEPTERETRQRPNLRRLRRNGRPSMQRSDSSESPPPKEPRFVSERLSPNVGYSRSIARLMNETNESELESSCSTESSVWTMGRPMGTPDSGVGTVVGSSTRNNRPPGGDVSDDPEYLEVKFRQRVKRARRNYRSLMESDSN